MAGEEGGPAGPKLVRLLYFVGAGFLCTAAINKWRELERKSIQQRKDLVQQSDSVHKAVE